MPYSISYISQVVSTPPQCSKLVSKLTLVYNSNFPLSEGIVNLGNNNKLHSLSLKETWGESLANQVAFIISHYSLSYLTPLPFSVVSSLRHFFISLSCFCFVFLSLYFVSVSSLPDTISCSFFLSFSISVVFCLLLSLPYISLLPTIETCFKCFGTRSSDA